MRRIMLFNLFMLTCFIAFCQPPQSPGPKPGMILVKGGEFSMGSNEHDNNKPVHQVTVAAFYMGKYEITVAQFNSFIKATNYITNAEADGDSSWVWNGKMMRQANVDWRCDAQGKKYDSLVVNPYPVVHVSWNDAVAYCLWLSNETKKNYRLPTEAEWEFAAGNGAKHTKFAWGNEPPEGGARVANLRDAGSGWDGGFSGYNDGYKFLAPAGSFKPNLLGFYDMTGNVTEWCSDWSGNYTSDTQQNPKGPSSGTNRVCRGGSWSSAPDVCGIADHNDSPPAMSRGTIGFRVVFN